MFGREKDVFAQRRSNAFWGGLSNFLVAALLGAVIIAAFSLYFAFGLFIVFSAILPVEGLQGLSAGRWISAGFALTLMSGLPGLIQDLLD